MNLQQTSAALALALLTLTSCKEKEFETPPLTVLKEYPEYALGRAFEVKGKPVFFGTYSFTYQISDGFNASRATANRNLYKIGDVFLFTSATIPENCSAVRGTWQEIEKYEMAREKMPTAPRYALYIEEIIAPKAEVPPWTKFP